MHRQWRARLIEIALVLAAGDAAAQAIVTADGAIPPPTPGMAQFVIYNDQSWATVSQTGCKVFSAGKRVAKLGSKQYVLLTLPAGEHRFADGEKMKEAVSIVGTAGSRSWVRCGKDTTVSSEQAFRVKANDMRLRATLEDDGVVLAIPVHTAGASDTAIRLASTIASEGQTSTPAPRPAVIDPQLTPGKLRVDLARQKCFVFQTKVSQEWSFFSATRKFFPEYDPNLVKVSISPGSECGVSREPVSNAVTPAEGQGFFMSFPDYVFKTTTKFVAGGGPYTVDFSGSTATTLQLTVTVSQASGVVLADTADTRKFAAAPITVTASTAPPSSDAPRPARTAFADCTDLCPQMIVVAPGSFVRGSTAAEDGRRGDEGPARQVAIARAFAIGRTEVTADEWKACVVAGACRAAGGKTVGTRPVTGISWKDARVYAGWLSDKTGKRYFLPSETEWEYAARAGSQMPWNTGDALISDDANIMGQFGQAVPVGGFPANAFGLHDTHGNVAEWTLDCHDVGYFGTPSDGGAAITPNCPARVARGGSFASAPNDARSAARQAVPEGASSPEIGFRVARAM